MDKKMLIDLKSKLEDIATVLYKGKVNEGIASINGVLTDISLMASQIDDEKIQNQLISDALNPLLHAMEDRDGTMMADVIRYELLRIVENML